MDPNDTNVFQSNIIDYYQVRPRSMEQLALSEVVAYYSHHKKLKISAEMEDDEEEDQFDENANEVNQRQNNPCETNNLEMDNVIDILIEELANASRNAPPGVDFEEIKTVISADNKVDAAVDADNVPVPNYDCPVIFKPRKLPKIIRWRRYDREQDRYNYVRVMLMLFHPWRIEPGTDKTENLEKTFEDNHQKIFDLYTKFVPHNNEEELEAAWREVEANEQEEETAPPDERVADEYEVLNPPASLAQAEFSQQIGLPKEKPQQPGNLEPPPCHEKYRAPRIWEKEMFLERIAQLNPEQREIYNQVLSYTKNGDPFHLFITGPAGAGKSFLIECIYQAVQQYYDHLPNAQPDQVKVLLCAPTGKAAFNIRGMTLHSAFKIPVSQFNGSLSVEVANTLRAAYAQLKLIIIDEISMVGLSLFNKFDIRLRQIMGVNQLFGGLPVIVLGDFNQLRPVRDR